MKNNPLMVEQCISFFMDDGIRPCAAITLDGDIEQTNDAFKQRLGKLMNRNVKTYMSPDTIEAWNDFIRKSKLTQQNHFEIFPLELSYHNSFVSKIQVMYYHDIQKVIAFFNLTNQHGIAPIKTYFNAFRDSKNFLVLLDWNGVICDVNDMHVEFFNKTRKDFIGKTKQYLMDLFPAISCEMKKDFMHRLRVDGNAEETVLYNTEDGEARYYLVRIHYDKETSMYVVQMQNCTERKILEKQLDHSGSLSNVGQIAASIAHEIRNPITTLKGFVQLLESTATGDTQKYLTVIDGEISRIEEILNELLLLSKPVVNVDSIFSLEVLVNEIVGIVYPKALMEGIIIEMNMQKLKHSLIKGNADKMKQVLLNLLKNALEAMSIGGKLTIQLEGDQHHLLLKISDTGKGMDSNQLKQIFMPFFTSKKNGTGLGLPFVLKVVEEHRGEISLASEVGKGTTFTVILPISNTSCEKPIMNEPFSAL